MRETSLRPASLWIFIGNRETGILLWSHWIFEHRRFGGLTLYQHTPPFVMSWMTSRPHHQASMSESCVSSKTWFERQNCERITTSPTGSSIYSLLPMTIFCMLRAVPFHISSRRVLANMSPERESKSMQVYSDSISELKKVVLAGLAWRNKML